MITYFYKILYKNTDVVYVGVTTRKITQRFREHVASKVLNKDFSCVEFDKIEHPPIDTLDTFFKERKKVAYLEQKYIQEEKDKGNNLLNISLGGEWGAHIYNKIQKEKFFNKYKNYDEYQKYKKRILTSKQFIWSWVRSKSINNAKRWMCNWIAVKTLNKTKRWITDWINHRAQCPLKGWMCNWIAVKTLNKTKRWLNSWVKVKTDNKTKRWLLHWLYRRSMNKTKRWLNSWVKVKTDNKTKVWLRQWIRANCQK